MLWLHRAAFFQFSDTGGYISHNLAAAAGACLEDYIASELCQCEPQSIGGIKQKDLYCSRQPSEGTDWQ